MTRHIKAEIIQLGRQRDMLVGIAPAERLGRNPSMDPGFLLPGTRSVISLAHPLDGDIIRRYLGREDQVGYRDHERSVYLKLYATARDIANLLTSHSFQAVVVLPNGDYRYKLGANNVPSAVPPTTITRLLEWLTADSSRVVATLKRLLVQALYKPAFGAVDWDLTPSFSHRYGAAAAGLGVIGWSGNLLTPQYGARVLLESVLTDAELEPDPMLKESPCDGCRTCVKVCQSGFIAVRDHEAVEIGGLRFVHNKKGHNIRCSIVCAGISGQSRYSEWATWSSGRIRLPHSDEHIREFWDHLVKDNLWKQNHTSQMIKNLALAPDLTAGDATSKYRVQPTCGFCQLVCWETRQARDENHALVTGRGKTAAG